MKRLISIIAIFTISMFFVSCGSSGVSCSTTSAGTLGNVKVNGTVFNGVQNAVTQANSNNNIARRSLTNEVVTFKKLDGTTLTTLPTQVKVAPDGTYEANITTPLEDGEEYRVIVGDMSAIVTNEANSTIGNISPATTMVSSMVEDGALPSEAKKSVNDSFGLGEGIDLSTLNPNTDGSIANRIAKLIDLLSESIPKVEKTTVIKSITNMVIKKKVKIEVSAVNVNLDDFNLSELAKESNATTENIAKVEVVESVIKSQIVKTVKVEKVEEKSSHQALVGLLKELENQELEELDVDSLKGLIDSLDEAIAKILADKEIVATTDDDMDFVLDLVKENLDENITTTLKSYKEVTKTVTTVKVKKVIKSIYTNSKASKLVDIKAKIDDDLLTKLGEVDADDTMSDILGAKLAQNIEDGDANVSGAISDTIENTILVDSIKNLKKDTPIHRLAFKKVVTDIKINIKIEKFTKITAENVDDYFTTLADDLKENFAKISSKLNALKLVIANLNKSFDKEEFQLEQEKAIKTVTKIKENKTVNIVKTINNLTLKVVNKFVESKGEEKVDIEDELEKGDVIVTLPPREITLPMPTLPSMPEFLKTPIKVTL
ncbi:DNA double-strand break repair Rad50 ATPase [hydrothermal vent metagenome]|uniref:DNA double-strand break repair Rad50 ATPase n=1 Tax=hydrothermal vent metagenome TaxID=652676 RepID=A0A1W1EKH9_9ZZZZ